MRFVCDSCRAQYMISDEKVGPKGVKVRCKKCGYVILVKKADANGHASKSAAPPAPAPVPFSSDPDDAMATQVLQNPLAGSGGAPLGLGDDNMTSPGINEEKTSQMPAQGQGGGLLDASEDEIGAVFDQVLNSGAHSIPKGSKGSDEKTQRENLAVGSEPDDRLSTRVIDVDVVKKLAEETGEHGEGKNGNGHAPAKDVPKTDWFVAIDDKQTGPLTLDKIKEHWERGEIGPDSLCWRAGFSDWIPVSEVADLASELAPRPAKPVMVAPVTVGGGMPGGGGVMSVPVESAFSAGGVMKSVRSEMQVPLAASAPEDTGSWQPSAASALASLVRDEMDALAKPPPKGMDAGEAPEVSTGGLLSDLPEASLVGKSGKPVNGHSNPAAPTVSGAGEMTSAHGPRNPYIANPGATYSSPAVTQYRPQGDNNKVVMALIIAVSVIAVLGIVAFVLVNVLRPQPQPVAQNTPPTHPQPTNTPPVAQNPPPNTNGQPNTQPPPNANTAGAQNPPQPAPNGTAGQPTNPPQPNPNTQAGNNNTQVKPTQPKPIAAKTGGDRVEKPVAKAVDPVDKPPKEEKGKPVATATGGDDEFAAAFGGDKPKKETKTGSNDTKAEESGGGGKKNVYIPPAPGAGGTVQESLGQSDIMEVVKGNIGPIKKCVDEQKAKEPGTSGKLVMKWTILTSGKTAKVEVVSDEFKSTYLAGCVGGLIKGWSFPKHKSQGEAVVFPFKF